MSENPSNMSSELPHSEIVSAIPEGRPRTRPNIVLSTIVVTSLFPSEMSFDLYGLKLSVARTILLFCVPWIVAECLRSMAAARYRFTAADLFMLLTTLAFIIVPMSVDGPETGLIKGGSVALDFCAAYGLMRFLPKSAEEIIGLLRLLTLALSVVGFLAIGDILTGGPIIHEIASALTGTPLNPVWTQAGDHMYRYGLFRAVGPAEHSILLGISMAYGLFLGRTMDGAARIFSITGCTTGLVCSFSSAPLLAVFMGAALLYYGAIIQYRHRWALLVVVVGSALLLFTNLHPSPFGWIFSNLLLDPQTGYFRLLIWQMVGPAVLTSPWVGWGFIQEWPKPDWFGGSIDSLWLRTALVFGIPASLFTGLSILAACWLPVRPEPNLQKPHPREERAAESLGIVLFLTIFLGFTVDYWGIDWSLLGFLAGLRVLLYEIGVDRTHVRA